MCAVSKYSGPLAELFYGLQSKRPYLTHHMIKVFNSGRGKVLYLNIQSAIQEIVNAIFFPFKSMERTLVGIMLKI